MTRRINAIAMRAAPAQGQAVVDEGGCINSIWRLTSIMRYRSNPDVTVLGQMVKTVAALGSKIAEVPIVGRPLLGGLPPEAPVLAI